MPKRSRSSTLYNKALDEALKSIYQVYGRNLSAFFRDVGEEIKTNGPPSCTAERRLGDIGEASRYLNSAR